jgi:hypothetical protein
MAVEHVGETGVNVLVHGRRVIDVYARDYQSGANLEDVLLVAFGENADALLAARHAFLQTR